MQKKKNNATEKVENIIDNNPGSQNNTIANVVNNGYDNDFENSIGEAERAQERVDNELEKIRRKEEKKKAKQEAKNESERQKRAALAKKKELKAEKKQNKLHLKQLRREEKLKHRKEKQELYEQKNAERINLANERKQKMQERKQIAYQKRKEAENQRKTRRKTGGEKPVGGFVVAIVALSVLTLVFATLFTVSMTGKSDNGDMYEASLERDFYDLVTYVDNIDTNMSKLMVSGDKKQQQKLINDIMVEANMASQNIGDLPLKDESKYYTAKYINQVGDYSKYLSSKLIDGEELTSSDWKNLQSMYEINQTLSGELKTVTTMLGDKFKFTTMLDDDKNNVVLQSFTTLEEGAVDYPKMIYDGPFSDGLESVEAKGLGGEKIDIEQAKQAFESYFKDYAFDGIEVVGETGGDIETFNVEGAVQDLTVYARITKIGGKLLSFNYFKDCEEDNLDAESAVKIAQDYIEAMGIHHMKPVWTNEYGAVQYVNFVYEKDGVIYYPDMIKVSVCKERKVVNSFDATSYYLNHTERTAQKAEVKQADATKNISSNISVENVRLCVIPKGNGKEKLCYEILGLYNDSTYYIYIDAITGQESQIFKVVKTTEGNLLI